MNKNKLKKRNNLGTVSCPYCGVRFPEGTCKHLAGRLESFLKPAMYDNAAWFNGFECIEEIVGYYQVYSRHYLIFDWRDCLAGLWMEDQFQGRCDFDPAYVFWQLDGCETVYAGDEGSSKEVSDDKSCYLFVIDLVKDRLKEELQVVQDRIAERCKEENWDQELEWARDDEDKTCCPICHICFNHKGRRERSCHHLVGEGCADQGMFWRNGFECLGEIIEIIQGHPDGDEYFDWKKDLEGLSLEEVILENEIDEISLPHWLEYCEGFFVVTEYASTYSYDDSYWVTILDKYKPKWKKEFEVLLERLRNRKISEDWDGQIERAN